MNDGPRIAVIIPTYGRPEPLRSCLDALASQSYPRDRFEVIVVDDGGREELPREFAAPGGRLGVRVIRQSHQGPAAARNAGAVATTAPFLAFTDDDCPPAPDWLERFAARLAEDRGCLYGGRVLNALDDNEYAVASQVILELAYAHHNPDPAAARFFATNNLVVPANGFRRVGGFDPTFRVASEDREFCARWQRLGLNLVYAPEAVVHHAHHLTLRGFWNQHFTYGRGAWQYHEGLRRQGAGRLLRDLTFHARFASRAIARLADLPPGRRLRVAALFGLWQIANAAGFLFEATRTAPRGED
jgi:GT2 family glycosyltransferase